MPQSPTHPVLTAPLAAQACLSAGLASSGLSLSLAEVQVALVETDKAATMAEAFRLHLTSMLLAREAGTRASGATTTAWISDHLRIGRGRARSDVEAARAVDPETGTLPAMGHALATGDVRREHLDIAVRALRELPTGMVTSRGAEIDDLLTDHARRYAPADAKKLAAHLIATLAPDGADPFNDRAYDRRGLDVRTNLTGMLNLDGTLDPVGGAVVKNVLDHLADPTRTNLTEPRPDGSTQPGSTAEAAAAEAGAEPQDQAQGQAHDQAPTTPRQRLADAMVEMARLALVGLGLVNPLAEPARVVVHCTPEQLAHPDPHTPCPTTAADPAAADPTSSDPTSSDHAQQLPEEQSPEAEPADDPAAQAEPDAAEEVATEVADSDAHPAMSCLAPGAAHCEGLGAISSRTLQTLACDAVMERVIINREGKVLRLETLGRLATRAQRRALAARDGGCAYPGCSAPPTWCDAHHITWWSRGGPTIMTNLCLLCQHHHTQIHREEWTITLRDEVAWFIPPPWIDPAREPRRNTIHTDITRTRRIGHRLLTGQPTGDLTQPIDQAA